MGPASGRFLRPSTVYFHYFLLTSKLFQVASCFFFLPALYSFLWLVWQKNGTVVFWLHMCCLSIFPLARVSLPFFYRIDGNQVLIRETQDRGVLWAGNLLELGKETPQETASHWRFPVECRSIAPGAHRFTMQGLVQNPTPLDQSHQSDPAHTLLLGWKEAAETAVAAFRILTASVPSSRIKGREGHSYQRGGTLPQLWH